MGFRDIAQIAGSAMTAQTIRLNTIASNLANADTVSQTADGAYRARKPVFAAISESTDGDVAGARVQVLDVVKSREPPKKLYEPGNPLADANGNVYYANIDPVAEMTDMLSASRAFSTNVQVLARLDSMEQELLKLAQ
ncbi:flagellar basal body rod protein FlgC [Burkholderia ubonensis]|uniref:flagellar basal body rod protein FlgC n=1 Tax=Burkholderia ubonensis TaxID=101571 RepID=UPI000752B3B2|nr:flagellar basal body rod protein FlgC [Burkholderia ubonensis]KWB79419.1 flagellar basal-body rod protein FlgC [Burkholderia ubonensis]